MMSRVASCLAATLLVGACVDMTADEGSADQAETGLHGAPEPHMFFAKDAGKGGGGKSPLMTFHGGTVLKAADVKAIFWGDWSNPGDKVTGIDAFFSGFSGSLYATSNTEYTDGSGQITSTINYLGYVFDTSTAPSRALSTSSAVAEACKIATQNNGTVDSNALYLIYTSTGAGHVNYCAWHSWGTCSDGSPIQVAYMPNLDGVSGCDAGDTQTGHSAGLAALANVTAHELSETITDPRGAGWFDSGGNENGDKCAWSFNGLTTFSNTTQWLIQGEWSNAAYDTSTGYANRSGQLGCLPNPNH